MRSIKPISVAIDIDDDFYNNMKKTKPDLVLIPYIEEKRVTFEKLETGLVIETQTFLNKKNIKYLLK